MLTRSTPPIPSWLREFRHPAYTNIYELCPDEPRVFGTESLYGDWDAELLLLAKDFAPRHVILERRNRSDQRPFRHGERDRDGSQSMGVRTNENLARRLVPELGGIPLLYGSAFGGLMRNDRETSGQLPDYQRVLQAYSVPLLRWCVTQLPRLRGIACLGREAFEVADQCSAVRLPRPEVAQGLRVMIDGRSLMVFRLYHPSRAFTGGWACRREEWRIMAEALKSATPRA